MDSKELSQQQAESTREMLTELWERIDNPGIDTEDADQSELDELPLEIVWEKGEPFAVVIGTGGPHIEIRGGGRHDGLGYTLHVYWAGDHVTLRGDSITRTGAYFREQVEELVDA